MLKHASREYAWREGTLCENALLPPEILCASLTGNEVFHFIFMRRFLFKFIKLHKMKHRNRTRKENNQSASLPPEFVLKPSLMAHKVSVLIFMRCSPFNFIVKHNQTTVKS